MASLLLLASPGAVAQPPAQAPRPAQAPAVDPLLVDRLVWSTLAALDHANLTGNYSVLRDLGSPSFQANNSAATLGGIFENIRTRRVDLSAALLVTPSYDAPPAIIQGGLLRAKGAFRLRPTAIAFDLIFQNVEGQWRVLGISIAPVDMAAATGVSNRR